MIDPTPEQAAAIASLVDGVKQGKTLLALRGLAGTGKTSLIPALQTALVANGLALPDIGAPTHRAAEVLRAKGMRDADTVHSLALQPIFDEDYIDALRMLDAPENYVRDADGNEVALPGRSRLPYDDRYDGLLAAARRTWLLASAFPDEDTMLTRAKQRGGMRALRSIGVYASHHLLGYGPKPGKGHVLILDEASMVGRDLLALCVQAYRVIILVGDPGQLPPVKDVAILHTVEGVTLATIHRQAADSSIVRLAYDARAGRVRWRNNLQRYAPDVVTSPTAACERLGEVPLLVWRNTVRKAWTHRIRAAKGYENALVPGEPLMCRSTSRDERLDGYYNNALFRVVAVDEGDARRAWVTPEGSDAPQLTYVHLEELDGPYVEAHTIPFRFAYAITTHTAQGSEWPLVALDMPELLAHQGMCYARGSLDEAAQWQYTAVTRAKVRLILLQGRAIV